MKMFSDIFFFILANLESTENIVNPRFEVISKYYITL